MKLSINKNIINKNEQKANQSKYFEPFDLTPEQFSEYISQGFAFSYQFNDSHRKADNFICSDIIAADFDSGITLEEALNEPFFIDNASILYTTPSHTEDSNRFRIIFQLPRTITDKDELRSAQQGLTKMFPADKAAVDPARQFYGSKGCTPKLFKKILSDDNLQNLIELGREPLNQSDLDGQPRIAGTRSTISIEQDDLIKTGSGEWKKLSDIEKSQPVYCPFHHDKNPSAFTTQSRYGSRGVHCSKCQQTFWQKRKQPEQYNFLEFVQLAHKEFNYGIGTIMDDIDGLEVDIPNPNRVISSEFLDPIDIQICKGITLIKSPKGSGKTQYLKRVVEHCKQNRLSVLLIGHRRSLLQALSSSLGLVCYLDNEQKGGAGGRNTGKYYAISVDSLATILKPSQDKFDVVLVDESEQVLSHLISDTMDQGKKRKCYLLFQHYIRAAKQVVALDADLNNISIHAFQRFGSDNPLADTRLILNEYKVQDKDIAIYASESHLQGSIFKSLADGERLFVACNSKKQVDALVKAIQHKFGAEFPLISITSENSGHPDVIKFIKNIKKEILNFRVLLVSPAMGTGIDITFPDDISHVDGVYGLFHANINTHFEIDQQISRVRNPKYIRLWISPRTFNFEYEVDPIKQELAESGVVPEVLKGYSSNGLPDFNWSDPYLNLYATIISAQRASKNKLRKNFIDLRKYNGWNVVEVLKKDDLAEHGRLLAKTGEGLRLDQYVHDIMSAKKITATTANKFIERRQRCVESPNKRRLKQSEENSEPLTVDENHSLDRYWIEAFYHENATEDLLIKDNHGAYREQIRNLEGVLEIYSIDPIFGKKLKGTPAHQLLSELMESAGLIDLSGNWTPHQVLTMDSLNGFVSLCKKRKVKIGRLLNMEVRKDIDENPITQLKCFLKMCGLAVNKPSQRTKNYKKIYEYVLDQAAFNEAMDIINRRKSPTPTSI